MSTKRYTPEFKDEAVRHNDLFKAAIRQFCHKFG